MTAPSQGLRVRHEVRAEDDGYRSPLAPGLRSSTDAVRLSEEIAFASGRLDLLASDPPGLYGEVRRHPDVEQASWLALLIAYIGPLEEEDPFRAIRAAVTDWRSGELPDLDGVALGPRTSHDPARGTQTLLAYRAWAERAGGQRAAFTGDAGWSAERRFERAFERLSLPGLGRSGRYDLLVTLGRVGRYDLRADSLQLIGGDATTLAAKRVLGIGDRFNLERRARALAEAIGVPVEALDLALANWAAPARMTLGIPAAGTHEQVRAAALHALGV